MNSAEVSAFAGNLATNLLGFLLISYLENVQPAAVAIGNLFGVQLAARQNTTGVNAVPDRNAGADQNDTQDYNSQCVQDFRLQELLVSLHRVCSVLVYGKRSSAGNQEAAVFADIEVGTIVRKADVEQWLGHTRLKLTLKTTGPSRGSIFRHGQFLSFPLRKSRS